MLKEEIGLVLVTGGALIIAGIAIVNLRSKVDWRKQNVPRGGTSGAAPCTCQLAPPQSMQSGARASGLAAAYSPTPSPGQYHPRSQA